MFISVLVIIHYQEQHSSSHLNKHLIIICMYSIVKTHADIPLNFYTPRISFLCRGQQNRCKECYECCHVMSPSSTRHCCSHVSHTFTFQVQIILTKNHWPFAHKNFFKYPPNSLVNFNQRGGGGIFFWLFSPTSKFCSMYTPYNIYQVGFTLS
jgi:hypothetical protein